MKTKQHILFAALLLSCIGAGSLAPHSFNSANFANSRTIQRAADTVVNVEPGEVEDRVAVTVDRLNYSDTSASIRLTFKPFIDDDTGIDYSDKNTLIGYGTTEEDYQPGVLVYTVNLPNGANEQRQSYIKKVNTNLFYDIVSGDSGKGETIKTSCDVTLAPGEVIDPHGIEIRNLFRFDDNSNVVKDAQGNPEKRHCKTTYKSTTKNVKFEDIVNIRYVGSSKFNGLGTAAFKVSTNMNLDYYYERLTARQKNSYKNSQERYESGEIRVDTKLQFTKDTIFTATTENGEVITFNGTAAFVPLTATESDLVVYHKSLNLDGLESLTATGFSIIIDSFDTKVKAKITAMSQNYLFTDINFGVKDLTYVDGAGQTHILRKGGENPYFINSDAILIGTCVSFVLIYEIISFVTYFYLKKKYAQDIFRRVRTKPYWTNNTMGLVASGSLLTAIVSISLRLTVLGNSMPVYNPIDILIVVFSVTAIIFCGYFIKYFMVQIKNIRDKKRNEKLHLNRDKEDDGTIAISK